MQSKWQEMQSKLNLFVMALEFFLMELVNRVMVMVLPEMFQFSMLIIVHQSVLITWEIVFRY